MRLARICWLALLCGAPAIAEFISDAPRDIELTVYREAGVRTTELSLSEESSGIAMVTESRTIELPAGTSVVRFRGVAAGMVPQTAKLFGVEATIVEANFDYNLLAPGTLIAKSLGRTVRLIRSNPSTGEVTERRGILRSGPAGVVVDFNGEIEALNCSGLNERLVFDNVPEDLAETPTLSLLVRSPTGGKYEAQLSYLALGLDWSADYIAELRPDGRTLNLSGWLTLVNRRGSPFMNAKTNVVAGTLSRVQAGTVVPEPPLPRREDACWPIGDFARFQRAVLLDVPGMRMFRRSVSSPAALEAVVVTGSYIAKASELGDYKMYTVPVPTSVAPRQIKQVQLLQHPNVRYEQLYEYKISMQETNGPLHPTALLRLKNVERSGLGVPLPSGTLSVINNAEGRRVLAGEDALTDTPIDGILDIRYARTMDIWTRPQVIKDDRIEDENGRKRQLEIEVEIANDKPVPISLEILHMRDQPENFRIVKSSRRPLRKNGDPLWRLQLRSGQREILRYTVEQAR